MIKLHITNLIYQILHTQVHDTAFVLPRTEIAKENLESCLQGQDKSNARIPGTNLKSGRKYIISSSTTGRTPKTNFSIKCLQ